jgi:hypothetical protein
MPVCEKCGSEIEPEKAVEYIEQLPVLGTKLTPGSPPEKLDGRSAYFHSGHAPKSDPNWRLADPEDDQESDPSPSAGD